MRSTLLTLTLGLGLVAACGDDGTNHLADAPVGTDATQVDATPIDAAILPVTVTVTLDGSAATGAKVYFLQPDGTTLVSNTATDATGEASAIVKAGGSVTVIDPQAPPSGVAAGVAGTVNSLHTFAGVKPGDKLHLDLVDNEPASTTITFDVTVASAADAVDYKLGSTCGNGGQVIDLTSLVPPPPPESVRAKHAGKKLHPLGEIAPQPTVSVTLSNCHAKDDVVVAAYDDGGNIVGSTFLPQQTLADAAPFTFAGPYDAATGVTLNASNASPIAVDMNVDSGVFTAGGEAYEFDAEASQGSGAGSDVFQVTLGLPPAATLANTVEAFVMSVDYDDTVFDQQSFAVWGPPADSKLVDLSTLQLDHYASGVQFDATTQQVQWTVGSGALAPDAVETVIDVTRDAEGVTPGAFTWSLATIGTQTGAVQYPTLPTDVFDFVVAPSDGVTVEQADTAKVPGGYDTIRAHAFDFVDNGPQGLFAVGTTGSASLSSLIVELPSVRANHGKRAVAHGWRTQRGHRARVAHQTR